jgi:uncharacterized OB-fold protein
MKYCPNCSTKVDDDAQFCPHCGAPIPYEEKPAPSTKGYNFGLSVCAIVFSALGGIIGFILAMIGFFNPRSCWKARTNCEIGFALSILWALLYIATAIVLIALMIAGIL